MTEHPPTTYQTSDFYLAAFLKAHDKEISKYTRNGRQVTFHFPSSPDVHALVVAFTQDGLVPAQSYREAIKHLKYLIYEGTG